MRHSLKLVFAFLPSTLLLAYASGCGEPFSAAPAPTDDGGPETSCNCGSGDPDPDSGTPKTDSGKPDPDSGKPDPDAGTEPQPDSGCGGCDSGTPDTGMPDSGSPDTGMMTDSGTDSGMMTDSGTDSGMMTDSGTDSGMMTDSGMTDSGTDAADAGPCVDLTTTCAGDQPLICQAGAWTTNGGVCNYGCNSGACLCDDPYSTDGGTGRFKPVFGGGLEDMTTGLTWYTTSVVATTEQLESSGVSVCTGYGARIPHESELLTVVAQQSPNVFCSPKDMDSQFFSLFSLEESWYWTDTAPALYPLHHEVVNVSLGTVGDGDGVLTPPLPVVKPDNGFVICVSP